MAERHSRRRAVWGVNKTGTGDDDPTLIDEIAD